MANNPTDKSTVPAPSEQSHGTTKPSTTIKPTQSNKQTIQDAIKIGQDLIKKETTKAQTAMVMYRLLFEDGWDQETIVDSFIKGASLTPMGARGRVAWI